MRRWIKLGTMLPVLLAIACHSGKDLPKPTEAIKQEQTTHHIVIGLLDAVHLEYLDMTAHGSRGFISSFGIKDVTSASIDLAKADKSISSDGKWTAHCEANGVCTVDNIAGVAGYFSVSSKGILTPLYWSPDREFVFFVRQGPTWRFPARCSLEDEYDVTVYELDQKREDVVGTVCGGFPYGSLRWYKLKED